MKATWRLLLTASFIIQHTQAFTLYHRDGPDLVELMISRKDVPDPVGRDNVRRKRDKTVGQVLDNEVCGCALFQKIGDRCVYIPAK